MYVGDILGRRALYTPDDLAVVDPNVASGTAHRLFSYRQLNERANRLACWLQTVAGVGKGDRVGILAYNGVEFLDAFFACGKLGAILVCYNWRLHPRELVDLVRRTTPRALIFSPDFAANVSDILAAQPVPFAVYIEPQKSDSTSFRSILAMVRAGEASGNFSLTSILRDSSAEPVTTDALDAEDTACLIFTGGTTGQPKAAQISHRMIAWNTQNTVIHNIRHGDVTVNVFPMFHTGGLLVYTVPLLIMGGTVILPRTVNAEQILTLIQQYRATIFSAVPSVFQQLTDAVNWASADLSNLRICLSGGAPMPIPLIERYQAEKKLELTQGFGMTEFGPGGFSLPPTESIRKAGSIGRPNFFVDATILADDGQELGADQIGELALKGPSMCSGYFDDPTPIADSNGWFHTGDLARRDADGYYFIVDRRKDMYLSGGENVYPTEVEHVLYQHSAVQQCAVVGIPDEKWGEVGVAFVVLKPGAALTDAELITYVRDRLARYKVPKHIQFVDTLPISAAGKILKRELRQQYLEA